jgi:predicted lipid-binding transport protein (Tim44 family)
VYMKKYLKHVVCVAIISSLVCANIANAKRFGGGRSVGRQNTNAVQRANNPDNAPPMQQGQQSQQQQQNQAQNNNPYQQQPQKPKSNMAGILGGVAAGLGLAWLASKLGMGGMFSNIIMIALLFFGFMMLMAFFRKKQQAAASPYSSSNSYSNPNAYSNNTNSSNMGSMGNNGLNNTATSSNYSANNNAGNSLGQNTQNSINQQSTYPIAIENLISDANTWFTKVQKLSDNKDYSLLQTLLSPELFNVVKADLMQSNNLVSHTVTQNLQSNILDWRETQYELLVTIQYRGNVSEDGAPFESINEAWTFTQDKANNPTQQDVWKLDGISQLNA